MSVVAKSLSFQASLLVFPLALLLAFVMLFVEIRRISLPEAIFALEVID
jgi:uncharacterized membrane protein